MKEEIQNFDARKITPEIRKNVEGFLKKNGNSFDPKVIPISNFFFSVRYFPFSLHTCSDMMIKVSTTDEIKIE